MKLSCPFCPEQITPETTICPSCCTTYDLDTLKFLRLLVRGASKNYPDDRRDEIRAPTTVKVSYPTPMEFVDNYLHNLGLGGLFVKTETPLSRGEKILLKIFLPDNEKMLEVRGEVVWTRGQEEVTTEGTLPAGMGIRFLELSKEGRKRIIDTLSRALRWAERQAAPDC